GVPWFEEDEILAHRDLSVPQLRRLDGVALEIPELRTKEKELGAPGEHVGRDTAADLLEGDVVGIDALYGRLEERDLTKLGEFVSKVEQHELDQLFGRGL